jgi:tetratricopeptide (TPR) repeat protein
LIVWLIAEALPPRSHYRTILGATTILIITALSALAWKEASYWRDPETLWKRTIAVTPLNYEAEINLATLLFQRGQIDDAIKHVEVAMHRSSPGAREFDTVHDDLAAALAETGALLIEHGNDLKAIPYLEAATKLLPDSARDKKAQVDYNLGCAFQEQRKTDDAITYYQKAVDIRPDYTDAENNLANAFIQKGLFAKALATYEQALKMNPGSILVRNNMAWQLATCPDPSFRDGGRAVTLCEEAQRMSDDNNAFVLHTLAAAYAQNHQFDKAIETANRALALAVEKTNSRLEAALRQEIALYRRGSALLR